MSRVLLTGLYKEMEKKIPKLLINKLGYCYNRGSWEGFG